MNLIINNLSCKYNDVVVFENFNLNIDSGIYFINGQNGSGKTTLFNVLYKLNESYSGVIKINNKDISSIANDEYRNCYITYLKQNDLSLDSFKVKNILDFLNIKADDTFYSLISELNIKNFSLSKALNKYSPGQKQKLKIIFSLLKNSPIIILDEPCNNLDKKINDILKLVDLSNKIVLISDHNNECDNFIELKSNYSYENNLIKSEYNDIHKNKLNVNCLKSKTKILGYTISLLMSFFSVILYLFFININYVFNDVNNFSSATDFDSNTVLIRSPINSSIARTNPTQQMLNTHSGYFSKDEFDKLQNDSRVKMVQPLGVYDYLTLSDGYDGYIIGQDFLKKGEGEINDIRYSSLIDPKSVNDLIAPNRIRYPTVNKIVIGNIPKDNSNEVMISKNLADKLIEKEKSKSYEDIIENKVKFLKRKHNLKLQTNDFNLTDTPIEEVEFNVVAIYDSPLLEAKGYGEIIEGYNKASSNVLNNNFYETSNYESLKNSLLSQYSTFNFEINMDEKSLYPSLLITANDSSQLKSLIKDIKKNDKYIMIESNQTNSKLSIFKYVKMKLYTNVLFSTIIIIIFIMLLKLLCKMYDKSLVDIFNIIEFYGVDNVSKKKFIFNELFQIIMTTYILYMIMVLINIYSSMNFNNFILFISITLLQILFSIIHLSKRIEYVN